MKLFPYGHATHPQWRMAAGLVLAQVRAQMALKTYAHSPTLALLYITDHYSAQAQEILDHLREQLPAVSNWSGTVGVGIASNNAEYFDEPALALMLCDLPVAQYRVFSGVAPLGPEFKAHTALVHADGTTADLPELIEELAQRTAAGYLFGGLSSSRGQNVQFAASAAHPAGGVFSGGLSGVAFAAKVGLIGRVTQGCVPVAKPHQVSAAENFVVNQLDGEAALDVMLRDLHISMDQPQQALAVVRATLVGVTGVGSTQNGQDLMDEPAVDASGHFGNDVVVRQIIGLDPARRAIAVGEHMQTGMQLVFCQRNAHAAKADLIRVCSEIREQLEPEELAVEAALALAAPEAESAPHPARGIAGAIYVSCTGRGGAHFGGPSAELQIVRRALGDVPLVGFFANGEIARNHLYGYTGVLTVFTANAGG